MEVYERFNIVPNHKSLYVQAFTHTSYANEHGLKSYERLEYLGDAVLELIMSEYLFKNTEYEEGKMTKKMRFGGDILMMICLNGQKMKYLN